jgi:Rieske 2Fe-2S family protein
VTAVDSVRPAPVDPDALEAVLRPHGESLMLPAAAYVSAEVLAWERRELFAGQWTCVGRVDELFSGATTQHALGVGDVGVLLTLADDGLVRGFANVCRHRGHELLPSGSSAARPAAVCPYHGWAYTLNGELRTAPGMREFGGFDAGEFGLVPVAVEEWEGWLFVNARGGAAPFRAYVGGMAGLVAPYRPRSLSPAARHTYDVAANWKVIVENYHECYHCPLIHPELCKVSPPTSGDNWDLPGAWVGGLMDLRPHAETMSLDGKSNGTPLPGVNPRTVSYLGLFPNLLVSLHPDYVMTHRITPVDPGRTSIECSWYFPAGVEDPAYAVDFWDITNREDWAACESVQRGLNSPHFRPGPLAPNEDAVYQWVTLIARAYQGKGVLS